MKAIAALGRHSDVVLAGFVVAIVATLLVPLPPAVLDVLLVTNIGVTLTLLVSALYADEALSLSSFPTLVLLATLFRLSLNVSSTRLILGTGTGGRVIEAFGAFVVGGNYLVGAVVFLILTIIEFIVVAKGAERVAEVAARFTLDALPGKQLSIDADIRSGACSQAEGRARRRALEMESQLYGALDGAMKFVKGDAIAGLVITAVNVAGGLVAGTAIQGMSLSKALSTYTLLSIGDGLVSQIPALLTAVAAGLVVTRVGGAGRRLATDVVAQIFGQPKALGIVGVVLGLLSLVPGLPLVPFAVLSLTAGGAAVWRRHEARAGAGAAGPDRTEAEAPADPGARTDAAPAGPAVLALELGDRLDPALVDALVATTLPEVRARLGAELGLPIPGVRVRPGALAGRAFRILVHEVPAGGGELPAGAAVEVPPEEAPLLGLSGRPAEVDGAPAFEVDAAGRAHAEAAGLPLVEPEGVLALTLAATLRRRAADLLSLQTTQLLLDRLEARAPAVVREATRRVPSPILCEILRRLLEEGVSLVWLERILESLASVPEGGAEGPGAVVPLVERARQGLGRQLVHRHAGTAGLEVLLLDPLVEDLLREARVETPDGPTLALSPEHQEALVAALGAALGGEARGVLLAPADLRRYLWRLASTIAPGVGVLAYQELPPDAQVRPVGRIAIEGLDPLSLAAGPAGAAGAA